MCEAGHVLTCAWVCVCTFVCVCVEGLQVKNFLLLSGSSLCPFRSGFAVGSGRSLLGVAWSPKTVPLKPRAVRRRRRPPRILPFLLLCPLLRLDFLPWNPPSEAETRKHGTFRNPAMAVPGAQLGLGRKRRKCSKQNQPREGRARGGRGPGMSGAMWRIPAKR